MTVFVQRDVVDPPTCSQLNFCKLQPFGKSRLMLELHGITRIAANRGMGLKEAKSN